MASLNAGPEYYAAEERYRQAKTVEEKLAALQEMLRFAPKHKSSESLLLEIKSKIAKVKKEAETEQRKAKARKSGGGGEFVRKQGGSQICIIGSVNAGKTTLFNLLTDSKHLATATPFETKTLVPGMWFYNSVQIQILDTPSIMEQNKSRIFAFARGADLVVEIIDSTAQGEFFEKNNPIFLRERKIIQISKDDFENTTALEKLKEQLYSALELVRVYTKPPRGEVDKTRPIVLKKGSATVRDVAEKIRGEIAEKVKFAKVWGSGKFPGQQVPTAYELKDGDVVELH